MRRFVRVALTLAIIGVGATASGFDGSHQGFVIGGGLGFAPIARQTTTQYSFCCPVSQNNIVEEQEAAGVQLLAGYGWEKSNQITLENNTTVRTVEGDYVAQGFIGPVWYHYYRPDNPGLFTAAGLGMYYCVISGEDNHSSRGAYLIGAGYELDRNLRVAVYFSGGRSNYHLSEYGQNHLNILLSAVVF